MQRFSLYVTRHLQIGNLLFVMIVQRIEHGKLYHNGKKKILELKELEIQKT